jgi:threonine synthase
VSLSEVNISPASSAAIYGLRNKENVSIFILHPKGRVSPIQEAQMTTISDANVHNVAVKGTFDDCQVCSPGDTFVYISLDHVPNYFRI